MNYFVSKGRLAMASIIAASAVFAAAPAQAALEGFAVTEELFAEKGTSTSIPGSGTSANISSTWNPKDYATSPTIAVFELTETHSGAKVYLRIDVTAITGVLVSNPSVVKGIGIFQTNGSTDPSNSGSQGLKDPGTFSVYVAPTNTSNNSISGDWSVDLQFSFFDSYTPGEGGSVGTFGNARNTQLLLTTLDIDWDQRYFVKQSDFTQNFPGTGVVPTNPEVTGDGFVGFTSPSKTANFYDDEYAASSLSSGGDSFTIRLSHHDVALYMFELRNPPESANPLPYPIPEPGFVALLGIGGAAFLFQRLRRRAV